MKQLRGHQKPPSFLYEIASMPRATIIDLTNIAKIELYSEYCRIIDLKNNTIQLSHEWAKLDPVFSCTLNSNNNIVTKIEFDKMLSIAMKRYVPIFYEQTDESYY